MNDIEAIAVLLKIEAKQAQDNINRCGRTWGAAQVSKCQANVSDGLAAVAELERPGLTDADVVRIMGDMSRKMLARESA